MKNCSRETKEKKIFEYRNKYFNVKLQYKKYLNTETNRVSFRLQNLNTTETEKKFVTNSEQVKILKLKQNAFTVYRKFSIPELIFISEMKQLNPAQY